MYRSENQLGADNQQERLKVMSIGENALEITTALAEASSIRDKLRTL